MNPQYNNNIIKIILAEDLGKWEKRKEMEKNDSSHGRQKLEHTYTQKNGAQALTVKLPLPLPSVLKEKLLVWQSSISEHYL
jgi:hypothetical protein